MTGAMYAALVEALRIRPASGVVYADREAIAALVRAGYAMAPHYRHVGRSSAVITEAGRRQVR